MASGGLVGVEYDGMVLLKCFDDDDIGSRAESSIMSRA